MTKGEVFQLFLRYVDEATSNGQPVDTTQYADYEDKYNYFLDDAVKHLAIYRPVKASIDINLTDINVDSSVNGIYRITLSDAIVQINTIENDNGKVLWRIRGENVLIVTSNYTFPITIYYDKKPDDVPSDALDSYVFELDSGVHGLIALWCAVLAAKNADPTLSGNLENQFNQAAALLNVSPKYSNTINTIIPLEW
jgi:hypothetical protein